MDAVALLRAEAGTSPSGTGSFSYFTNFSVLIDNFAFAKQVQILGHDVNSGSWVFHPLSFSASVPGNGEIWTAHVGGSPIDQFVVEYEVSGTTFWDNNSGFNYTLDTHVAESTDGVGSVALSPNVLSVAQEVDAGGNLKVDVLVKNIAFAKQVGIVYTTDNWVTFLNAFGTFQQSFQPFGAPHEVNAELWEITAFVGVGKHGQFAVFYGVNSSTSWDNNFGRNYSF
jgi:Carbohydrate/starch-binding module (family 21)